MVQELAVLLNFNYDYDSPFLFIIQSVQNINMENPISWFLRTAASAQKNAFKIAGENNLDCVKSKSSKRLFIDKLPPVDNHTDIKVISPFYDRNKCMGNRNCPCQFHKRIRQQQATLKRNIIRKQCFNSTQLSPNHRVNKEQTVKPQPRLSCKAEIEGKNGKKKLGDVDLNVRFQGQLKVQHRNQQFQQYLKDHCQQLLKKYKHLIKDPHIIKNSVREIFQYIHNNLRERRSIVKRHIDSIIKDRDITDYYIERYDQLRSKLLQKNKQRNFKTAESAWKKGSSQIEERKINKKLLTIFRPNNNPSLHDSRKGSTRKTMRRKTQKLILQTMIDDIEEGYEVDKIHLKKLQQESVQDLIENLTYLKRVIDRYDEQTLIQIRDNILQKLKIKYNQNHSQQSAQKEQIQTKRLEVEKAIELLNAKIQQLSLQAQKNDGISRMSRGSHRSKNGSNYTFKRESAFRRETGCIKSIFKPPQGPKPPQPEEEFGLQEDNGQTSIPNDAMAITKGKGKSVHDQQPDNKRKNQILKLAKYRRLSHEVFGHRKFFSEDSDFQPQPIKLTIKDIQEIGSQLDYMQADFKQHFKTLKQIQHQIHLHHLKSLIITQDDCLLTAKRKARAFKKIMKEEQLTPEMKYVLREYLNLIEQHNYVKNRKWAHNKFKNILLGQNNIELFGEDAPEDQDMSSFIKNAIVDIFGFRSKLLYYTLKQTQYSEEDFDFQENIFSFMRANIQKQQESKKNKTSRQKPLNHKKQSSRQEQIQRKQQELIQIGLNNRYSSSYFGLTLDETRIPYDSANIDYEIVQRRKEADYLQLCQRLQRLTL